MSIVVLLKVNKVLNKSTHFPLTEINYQYLLLIGSEIFKKKNFNKLYLPLKKLLLLSNDVLEIIKDQLN